MDVERGRRLLPAAARGEEAVERLDQARAAAGVVLLERPQERPPKRRQHLLVLQRQQERVRADLIVRGPAGVAAQAGEAAGVAGLDHRRAQTGGVGRDPADADRLFHALVQGGCEPGQAGLIAGPADDGHQFTRLHRGHGRDVGVRQRALEPVEADVAVLTLAHDGRERRRSASSPNVARRAAVAAPAPARP